MARSRERPLAPLFQGFGADSTRRRPSRQVRRAPPRLPVRLPDTRRCAAPLRPPRGSQSNGTGTLLTARALLTLLWLLHWLPLGVQAWLGNGLGRAGWHLVASRRKVALRNLELCFPELAAAERERLAREHFRWLGRSLLERGLLWYASAARLKRLIHVEGDVQLAERSEQPVMWLAPHFMGLDVAGASVLLFQKRQGHLDLPGAERPGDGRGAPARAAALRQRRDLLARRGGQGAGARDPQGRRLLQPARHGLRHPRRRLRAVLRRAGGHPARAFAAGQGARHGRAADRRRDPARRPGLPGALRGTVERLPERRPGRRRGAHEPLDRERDPAQSGAVPLGPSPLQDAATGRAVAVP